MLSFCAREIMNGKKRDISYHARFCVTHAVHVRLAADQRSFAHVH
jgi:hypothetical protein